MKANSIHSATMFRRLGRRPFPLAGALLALVIAGVAIGLLKVNFSRRPAPDGGPYTPLNMPSPRHPSPLRAWVVYEWSGGLYTTRTDNGRTRQVAERGIYPRWSPDGSHLAFWRGNDLVQSEADGNNPTVLAQAELPYGIAYNPDGSEILFVDGITIKAVTLRDRTIRTVLEGMRFCEIDLAPGGRFIASVASRPKHGIFGFDLAAGRDWEIGSGCSASLSPDGRLSTRNGYNHRYLHIDDWATGTPIKDLPGPQGHLGDNQFWSNSDDWIAIAGGERSFEIYIQRVSDAESWRITFCDRCDRPDLFVPP